MKRVEDHQSGLIPAAVQLIPPFVLMLRFKDPKKTTSFPFVAALLSSHGKEKACYSRKMMTAVDCFSVTPHSRPMYSTRFSLPKRRDPIEKLKKS